MTKPKTLIGSQFRFDVCVRWALDELSRGISGPERVERYLQIMVHKLEQAEELLRGDGPLTG